MLETLLGGLLGGVFRLAPEVLKLVDAKNERKHELAMQDKALEFEKVRGAQKMEEIGAQADSAWNTGAMTALVESIKGQSEKTGVKWADALSTIMRPIITLQWVVILYPAALVAGFSLAVGAGTPPLEALTSTFGAEEKAIAAAILNFWFLGRVLDKANR
jgi:hypothetical protein